MTFVSFVQTFVSFVLKSFHHKAHKGLHEGHKGRSRVNLSVRMIVGTGVDIIEVERVAEAIERYGERFLRRIYTAGEIKYCQSKRNSSERFAARFAAKEAAFKAIGTGLRMGVAWKEVEVRREPSGRPSLNFSGAAAAHAVALGMKRASLSISHTAELAIANVILED